MSPWITQMGYPLVTVEQKFDGNKCIIKFEQSRFLQDGSKDESNSIWSIPIIITTESNLSEPIYKFLLKDLKEEIVLENIKPNEWINVC